MRTEDNTAYMAASALAFPGMLLGYYVPALGAILLGCLLLAVLARHLGSRGGAGVGQALRPFVAFGQWLARKDDHSWVRRAPFIGLVAGWLMHWIIDGLMATGRS